MINKYWWKWTINCAFGELAGIGAAGLIAYLVNKILGEPELFFEKIIVLLAMMFAGLIEGSFLGYFQWRVLKDKFPKIPKKEWMTYTIAIAVIGWFLGMLSSLSFVVLEAFTPSLSAEINFDDPRIFIFLSVSIGLILGALFGAFQWFSLKKYVQHAYQWIIANALGWGIGIGWVFLFASLPTEDSPAYIVILAGIIGGILAGLSVGAITGFFLIRLKAKP